MDPDVPEATELLAQLGIHTGQATDRANFIRRLIAARHTKLNHPGQEARGDNSFGLSRGIGRAIVVTERDAKCVRENPEMRRLARENPAKPTPAHAKVSR